MPRLNAFDVVFDRNPQALSAVVVDEMHLIGDDQRGFLLEPMLSKLRMVCPTKVQVFAALGILGDLSVVTRSHTETHACS